MSVVFSTPHDTSASNNATLLVMTEQTTGGATVTYTITNIVISNTNPSAGADDQLDVAHLGQTTGELAARLPRPLIVPADDGGSGRQLTFDYIGKKILVDGLVGTFRLAVGNSTALLGGTTASFYTVQSSTLTLAVNDAIRGQATLTLSR